MTGPELWNRTSLPDRHTLPAQRAEALVAAPRQASGLAAGPQLVAVAATQTSRAGATRLLVGETGRECAAEIIPFK